MNQETKVGIFLLLALAVLLPCILFIGNFKFFSRTDPYYIEFQDVEALPPKAAIKVAGVEIGKVSKIKLVNGKAVVRIDIDPEIKLHDDATARVASTGIIGTRFVELLLGSPDRPVLEPKSTIKGQDGSGLNQMISRLSTLFEEDAQYGDAVDNLKATLSNIRHVSDSLNAALGHKEQELDQVVRNVQALTANTKAFTADLREILEQKKEDVKVAITNIRSISEKLDAIVSKIERGEGTIGALVSDEKTATDVKEAIVSIKDTAKSAKNVFGKFGDIQTYWDYQFRYDFRDDESRSDVGIKFVPRNGKFYYVGVSNIGQVPENEKHTEFERKNRWNIYLGGDYGAFTGYAGAIRSRGGVGMRFRPFWFDQKWSKKFDVGAEVSDFSRDVVIRNEHLEGAWLAADAKYAIRRWLWIGARMEDILQRSVFMANVNVVFRDEDFAYLLGLAGAAR